MEGTGRLAFIPSPSTNGFHLGPLDIHVYGLMYVVAITLAVIITRRRWRAVGGNPDLVSDVALWAVPAGIIGGGIAAGAAVGIWRVHRAGADWRLMADAVAPALLVAQAVGRVGNYFNQELYGKPTSLPWGLEIAPAHRVAGYTHYATFQPSFLYELIFDLALAAALVWLGHHRDIRPPGLLALYVTGYSGYRIFEETIRIDSSAHFLGLRLNLFIAIAVALAGLAWFIVSQRRRPPRPPAASEPAESRAPLTP